MRLDAYRQVLRRPGLRSLVLVAMLARVPATAAGVTLTLHVVLDLDGSYGAAGLVGAVSTIGSAVGAPMLGRLVDRRGLRVTLALTIAVAAVFWTAAPALSYPALLVVAGVAGLFTMPVFSLVRQSIAALVPPKQRRPAYALDSMSVELSFMVGPLLAVLLVTQISATVTMFAIGAWMVASGVALFALDPPVHGADQPAEADARVSWRSWLRPRLVAILVISMAATFVLSGTDIALVAELREVGQLGWTGLVLAAWGAFSLAGGFVYGALPRAVSTVVLLVLLGALTMPVGLAEGWAWLVVALIPAGALCAPTLAATADAVARLVPAGARGEAMGWHSSAITLGFAVGAPVAGAVIDAGGPTWGFVVVGGVGMVTGLVLLPFARRIDGSSARAGPTPIETAGAPLTATAAGS